MSLSGLKRGGEPGALLDVRTFGIPENTPKAREGIELPDFEKLINKIAQLNFRSKANCAGQLKYLFPEREEEIREGLKLDDTSLRGNLIQIEVAGPWKILYAGKYRLLSSTLSLEGIISPEIQKINKIYAVILEQALFSADILENIKKLWYFKIIYPDFSMSDISALWEKGVQFLKRMVENEQWGEFAEMAVYLKTFFPQRVKEIGYQGAWSKLLEFANSETLLNQQGFAGYLKMYFSLAILDADEVKIDAQGLHLINHPVPESLGDDVPKQPMEREI